jgi:hypothetical protein
MILNNLKKFDLIKKELNGHFAHFVNYNKNLLMKPYNKVYYIIRIIY